MILTTNAVCARGLSLGYRGSSIVSGLSFEFPPGSRVAVIGPNGSGKSTLLKAIAGLNHPIGGTLELHAPELGRRSRFAKSLDRRARRSVALVAQAAEVDRSLPLTVTEAVRIARYHPARLLRGLSSEDRAEVNDAIERVGLSHLAGAQVHDLSGGQRQRMMVAQGLAQHAALLALDEPCAGLDIGSQELILRAIDQEASRGRTVVLSTHDLSEVDRCDLVLVLSGHQLAFGKPSDVLDDAVIMQAFAGGLIGSIDRARWHQGRPGGTETAGSTDCDSSSDYGPNR